MNKIQNQFIENIGDGISSLGSNSGIQHGALNGTPVSLPDVTGMGSPDIVNSLVQNNFIGNVQGGEITNIDDTNRPVSINLIPKTWRSPFNYDQHIQEGDLLLVDGHTDTIKEYKNKKTQRTAINLQQVNEQIFHGKAAAVGKIWNFAKSKGWRPRDENIVLDYDMDNVMYQYRHKQSDYYEDRTYKKKYQRTEKQMNDIVKEIEDKMETITNNGIGGEHDILEMNFTQEVVQQMRNSYDADKFGAFDFWLAGYDNMFCYLHPELINERYQFLGSVVDSIRARELYHKGKLNRQSTVTVAVRGPAYVKNIFANARNPKNARDTIPNKNFMGHTFSQHQEFHLALLTDGIKYSTQGGVNFYNHWFVPMVAWKREDILHQIHKNNYKELRRTKSSKGGGSNALYVPEHEWSTVVNKTSYDGHKNNQNDRVRYTKTQKRYISTNVGQHITTFVGTILDVELKDDVTAEKFKMACGINDYSKKPNAIQESYEFRKLQRSLKINIGTS